MRIEVLIVLATSFFVVIASSVDINLIKDIADLVEDYVFQGQFNSCLQYFRLTTNNTSWPIFETNSHKIISTQNSNMLPDMSKFNFQCLISYAFFKDHNDHAELRNLIHAAREINFKMIVIFGGNFKLFKSQFRDVQSKFLFVEEIKSNKYQQFHSYCPNCTKSWLEANQVWTTNRGFLLPKQNPFYPCDDPFQGKTLKIAIGGAYPAVYM